MMIRILPFVAFLGFASVPLVMGNAESAKEPAAKSESKADEKGEKLVGETKSEVPVEAKPAPKKMKSECLASEEVIQDIEAREQKLKQREEALLEREKEVSLQQAAIKGEVAKLETARAETQGAQAKNLAEREEKVNKLMETFETMSPKSAAVVLNGVDDELAVMALSRLSSAKAGKVMGSLSPDKSARLSEIMAFGRVPSGKEKARGESSERAPASKR